jgi:hypothetical protein
MPNLKAPFLLDSEFTDSQIIKLCMGEFILDVFVTLHGIQAVGARNPGSSPMGKNIES